MNKELEESIEEEELFHKNNDKVFKFYYPLVLWAKLKGKVYQKIAQILKFRDKMY